MSGVLLRDTASAPPSARPQEAVRAGSAGRHQLRAAIEARGANIGQQSGP